MTRTPPAHVTPPAVPAHPTRPDRQSRPRLSPDLLAGLASRLTDRDRWLLAMLHEHRVFTTTQITQLAFGSTTTTAHRLLQLWRHRVVDRSQPFTETGSAPMHYVLGDAGAAVLAATHGLEVRELGYRRDRALAILHSRRLVHTVGVNSLLTALVAHARRHPDTCLVQWWPEHRCTRTWGDLVRPDAYARWRHNNAGVDFFLEYDTGTEPLARLTAKLSDYADLADATGLTTPVLFWFPTTRRETHARTALRGAPIPVATAAHESDSGPADPVWRLLDSTGRVRLGDLVHVQHATISPVVSLPPWEASAGALSRSVSPMPPEH